MNLAIFYHIYITPNHEHGMSIVREQINALRDSGLLGQVKDFYVGVNGDYNEMDLIATAMPQNAILFQNSKQDWPGGEVPTLRELKEFAIAFPKSRILYFHTKGISYPPGSAGNAQMASWRRDMERTVIHKWRHCVQELERGHDSVGQWWYDAPNGSYWAGNFWWANADFIATLPDINTEGQIQGGRYEAEVWIGRGPRKPVVKSL